MTTGRPWVPCLALCLLSCSGDSITAVPNPGNLTDGRTTITNEPGDLAGRVTYFQDVPIPIVSGSGGMPGPAAAPPQGFSLDLVAEVSPPVVDGTTLQATSVEIQGNFAIVGYNVRGAEYLGGIDVFNITNKKRPVLESEAIFDDSDVNAVFVDNGNVFAAEATGDVSFPYPSVCEILTLQGHNLILEGNQRAPLASFAGTGVFAEDSRIYTTAGDQGGLTVLDRDTLEPVAQMALTDARGVYAGGGRVAVVQGTPGRLSVFDEATLAPPATYTFPGADIPESKSTVQILGGKALVAAGPAGVQILSLATGAVVGAVPRPDPASLGLDPSVVVTNAVAADGDLIFISNGEAGVYVARAAVSFVLSGSDTPQDITTLGRLQFDDLQSANHVAFKNDYLIVAAGLGGLKIVQLSL